MSRRTAVYRPYDAAGTLLYVGKSRNPAGRCKQHAKVKPWWPDVARVDVEWFDSGDEAEAAEIAAIRAERPRWNVQHAARPPQATAPRLAALSAAETAELEAFLLDVEGLTLLGDPVEVARQAGHRLNQLSAYQQDLRAERQALVLQMAERSSYAEIGTRIGLSAGRVQQIATHRAGPAAVSLQPQESETAP